MPKSAGDDEKESNMELYDCIKRFYSGKSDDAYKLLGCHKDGDGYVFRVWAPNAVSVRLVGSFNGWDTSTPPMSRVDGIWEQRVPSAKKYDEYKFYIERPNGSKVYKSDPYATHMATRPETSSKVFDISDYKWGDKEYLATARKTNPIEAPMNIYELHLGSWRKYADGNFMSYRQIADDLVPYVKDMGYTHIELMPVSEYPLDASWGYQVIGYFAPTSRYGTPHDFMYLVDKCHRAGIGVLLDWVGAHFPKDETGLYEFDGTYCYESADPLKREHPDWGTRIFDYTRNEVRSFLISNVCYWLREYHIDGIRADAVASMLYLDYGRKDGEWRRNRDGGNIDYDAIELLRDINSAAFAVNPCVSMIAEESTAFPNVTKPGYDGGLGFNFKWNMGWMHDTLDYMSADPVMRKGMHNNLTFSMTYAFSENFILPLSHDEVVHGKRSMVDRMPGNYDEKFANLRVMYAYMLAHPGKKLSFMGNEFGQFIEWDFKKELDWFLLEYDSHRLMKEYVKALNHIYLQNKALWENDRDWNGFQWIKADDRDYSIAIFRRIAFDGSEIICLFNFTPVERLDYRIGVPYKCILKPIMSSSSPSFGGKSFEPSRVKTDDIPCDGHAQSANLHIPPMSAVMYKPTYIRKAK